MKSVVRPPDRHPFEIYLLTIFTLYGFADVFGLLPTPSSIRAQLPLAPWLWSLLLAVGSAAALGAILWRRTPGVPNFNALLIEKVGLVVVGCTLIVSGVAILFTIGPTGAFQAANNVGFGAASFTQAVIIHRYVKRMHDLLSRAVRDEIIAEARRRGERI